MSSFCFLLVQLADRTLIIAKGVFISSLSLKLSRTTRLTRGFAYTRKHRTISRTVFVLALPIFPCSHPQSIVGANELNFRVRNGNGWTLVAINTNYV